MTDSNKDAAAVAAEEYARTIEAKYHIVPPMALFGPIKNAFLAGVAWCRENEVGPLKVEMDTVQKNMACECWDATMPLIKDRDALKAELEQAKQDVEHFSLSHKRLAEELERVTKERDELKWRLEGLEK